MGKIVTAIAWFAVAMVTVLLVRLVADRLDRRRQEMMRARRLDRGSQVLLRVINGIAGGPWREGREQRNRSAAEMTQRAESADSSAAAERSRAELCARWAIGCAALMAIEGAASRLRDPGLEWAAARLRSDPTASNAVAAASAAAIAYRENGSMAGRYTAIGATIPTTGLVSAAVNYSADANTARHAAAACDASVGVGIGSADGIDRAIIAAIASYRAGANIRPELLRLFSLLLNVK